MWRLELGFEEILVNIISYAYDYPGFVWVKTAEEGDCFRIEFADHGKPFDPLIKDHRPLKDIPLDEKEPGGYGIFLVKKNFKLVEYRYEKLFGQINSVAEHSEMRPSLYGWGIPVRGRFTEKQELATVRGEARSRFGWSEDAFVCLLAGGGGGMLPMEEIVGSLQNEKFKDIYVVAVTGHNDGLRKKLEAMQKGFSKREADDSISRLTVLGFTDEMPQLMQAADVVITKAGGVSLAECLECGANILIYHPLPGQEQRNTAFLQQEYGAAAVTDLRQLDEYLGRELRVSLPERLQKQKERKLRYGHRAAAGRIAQLTDKLRNR